MVINGRIPYSSESLKNYIFHVLSELILITIKQYGDFYKQ